MLDRNPHNRPACSDLVNTDSMKEIKLGDTSPTRDFNYIKDTVNGFIAALDSKKGLGEVINLGSNYEVSIGDTAEIIAEVMNADIKIINDERRFRPKDSEVERLCADNSKAKELFGWEPKYGNREGFCKGLEETAKWFLDSKNLDLYKSNIYNL